MSFSEITIYRTLPVVGGFIKIIDDNNNLPKLVLSEVPYSELKFGVTSKLDFIEFPGVVANDDNVDYQGVVRDLAIAKL
jgi:hypothetical protein